MTAAKTNVRERRMFPTHGTKPLILAYFLADASARDALSYQANRRMP
jgi:hypothetical protein